jgi:surfactin synthase thioesterase subunit
MIISGRATGEPAVSANIWSKGYGAAGYSLLTNLTKLVPGTTGYPVTYPASIASQSTELGARDMVDHLKAAAIRCPKQKFALGGHSQGGNVRFIEAHIRRLADGWQGYISRHSTASE